MQEKVFKPTDAELEILSIVWENGPSTVKFVNEKLNESRLVGYTTTLKTMQIMYEKELLGRNRSGRSHTYKALRKESETQGMILDKILDTVFSGSASKLVMQALTSGKTSPKEIEEIKNFIEKMKGDDDGNI
ncbi:MAG: BlaI/MecI/CopY family transcriptional regulator [Melioribacteraceae bacterium]|jgi:BlaI family penicillinase repressor|nr:BlaI/MecI/CopY family transcriptional regulator [Melioribacteraceae bacterium]